MNVIDFFVFQCVGRAIRGKTDYGVMVFADKVSHMHIQLSITTTKLAIRLLSSLLLSSLLLSISLTYAFEWCVEIERLYAY